MKMTYRNYFREYHGKCIVRYHSVYMYRYINMYMKSKHEMLCRYILDTRNDLIILERNALQD